MGLRRYLEGIKVCVDYALEKGCEPLMLYAGTGSSASSSIRHFMPDDKYRGRVLINPEYPQHVAMLGLDPVFELGQLLEEEMLCNLLHSRGWKGIIEYDCRPMCTTTTAPGLKLFQRFEGFAAASEINTDAIEAHVYRLIQIVTGTQEQGKALFANMPWEA